MKYRSSLLLVMIASASPSMWEGQTASADEPADLPKTTTQPARAAETPAGIDSLRDLRSGQWTISAAGAFATPTSKLLGSSVPAGSLRFGAGGRARLGWGVNRHLNLGIDGGFTRLLPDADCEGCGASVIDVGASLQYHVMQGFAVDPWISYGVGYRHILLNAGNVDETLSGIDVARLALGADYYPAPWFGIGPYVGADIGLRDTDESSVYGVFHTGLRITFDPKNRGVQLSPQLAGR